MILPALLFSLKIALAICSLLWFQIDFRTFLYCCENVIILTNFDKDCIPSTGCLGSMDILIVLILPINEHGICS